MEEGINDAGMDMINLSSDAGQKVDCDQRFGAIDQATMSVDPQVVEDALQQM